MNTDLSMDFTLLSFLLACASLYCVKKNKYTVIDTLYIFILTCFYYLILITLDNYQVNEHFQVTSGSHVPMLLENGEGEDEGEDENKPIFPKPLPLSQRKDPSDSSSHFVPPEIPVVPDPSKFGPSKPSSHFIPPKIPKNIPKQTHLDRHHVTPVPEQTHLDRHVVKHHHEHEHEHDHDHKRNGDSRPNTNDYTFKNPVSVTNITIDIDEKDSPVDRYRRFPRRRRSVENRQFDNGLYDDRIDRLERQIQNLENRPIERQIVRVPRRDRPPYFEKTRKCPVCPIVAEKPWSEWMDAKDQRKEYVRRDRRRFPYGDHNNRKWSDERGGNNPLPLLPLLPLLP